MELQAYLFRAGDFEKAQRGFLEIHLRVGVVVSNEEAVFFREGHNLFQKSAGRHRGDGIVGII